MAKLKLRIPTLDAVPKEQQAFYRAMEGGEGFILDHEEDGGWGIGDLGSLRGKLDEKTRDYDRVNAKLQQALRKSDGSLRSAEEVEAAFAQAAKDAELIATLQDKTKTGDQKLQQLVSEAKKPLEVELGKLKASVERYRASSHKAEKARVRDEVLKKLNPLDEWRDLIAADVERQIAISEAEDGTLSHAFLDTESGRTRMSALSGNDGPMQAGEFASSAELRRRFGKCLRGDEKKGAGIANNGQPSQQGAANGSAGGAGFANGDRFQVRGSKVILPPKYSQKDFNAAQDKATEIGGQIEFSNAEEGAAAE